jgi:hypothetical protein
MLNMTDTMERPITTEIARSEFSSAVAEEKRAEEAVMQIRTRLRHATSTGSPDGPWIVGEEQRLTAAWQAATARRDRLELLLSADDLATIARVFDEASRRLRTVLMMTMRSLPMEIDLTEARAALDRCRECERQQIMPFQRYRQLTAEAVTSPDEPRASATPVSVDQGCAHLVMRLGDLSTMLDLIHRESCRLGLR